MLHMCLCVCHVWCIRMLCVCVHNTSYVHLYAFMCALCFLVHSSHTLATFPALCHTRRSSSTLNQPLNPSSTSTLSTRMPSSYGRSWSIRKPLFVTSVLAVRRPSLSARSASVEGTAARSVSWTTGGATTARNVRGLPRRDDVARSWRDDPRSSLAVL